jgi:fucose permease
LLLLVIIYLAFISLGLPDSLLGSSWPVMHRELNSAIEFAGLVSVVVCSGTVFSSLLSTRLTYRWGTGKVVLVSVLMTAIALYGFSITEHVYLLVLFAIPLGLGAGAVDAALNHFVAVNYQSKHMNYLHSFWGVGATLGPMIMAWFLSQQLGWRAGYASISYLQFVLVAVLLVALPLWQQSLRLQVGAQAKPVKPLSNRSALKIAGVKWQLLTFFCYCSLELGAGLWAASYLISEHGLSAANAAFWTAMYYLGITFGRFFCGFAASFVAEHQLVRGGLFTLLLGVLMLMLPESPLLAKSGLVLIGLGCAPVYPNTIHLTPQRFGERASQAIIGLSMACAYVGSTIMPPLVGLAAAASSFMVLPLILIGFIGLMLISTERLIRCSSGTASVKLDIPTA